MSSSKTSAKSGQGSSKEWILALDNVLKLTSKKTTPGMQARVSCAQLDEHYALILPAEMADLQPQVLKYLHALGAAHNITLVEDQRSQDFASIVERRDTRPSNLALGVSLLLKQTGMPGPVHSLSTPHALNPGNSQIDIAKLIKMAAQVHTDAKRVVFEPNRFLTGDFSEHEPMTGYACKVVTEDSKFVLSYFNAPQFRATGYITNNQFVMHVFLAGGPLCNPQLWGPLQTMTDSVFRCQLFKSALPGHDFGLLYTTFYIDLVDTLENHDWWQETKVNQRRVGNNLA